MIEILAWGLGCLLVIITVSIHYEVMQLVSDQVIPWATHKFHSRRVIAVAIAALMFGHITEIWVWAIAYGLTTNINGFGIITGSLGSGFNDLLYFSAVSFTSLGDNNLHPEGAIRCLTASETLAGLMMTAWSASFTYLKMEEIWKRHKGKGE